MDIQTSAAADCSNPNASRNGLHEHTKDELVAKVLQLEAHVKQLQDIICGADKGKKPKPNLKPQKKSKDFDFKKYNKRHLALKICYLGWDYNGFAVQEDSTQTIEHHLFEALLRTKLIESRQTANYHRCGRTDKGVSAFSQVISITLRSNLIAGEGLIYEPNNRVHTRKVSVNEPEIDYVGILNRVLPDEIRVLAWMPVKPNFSARFDCTQRTYRYLLSGADLSLESMQEGCDFLVGEHDFRNLCKMDVGNGVTNYKRNIIDAKINILDGDGDYQLFYVEITGKAFLWHQIRCIVAVLILIGQGKEEPDVVQKLLDIKQQPRKPQYPMSHDFPLILSDCKYGNIDENWLCDKDISKATILHFKSMWNKAAIKAEMLKNIAKELESDFEGEAKLSGDLMLEGSQPRQYKPLLKRPLCHSLEARIEHYKKRRTTADQHS